MSEQIPAVVYGAKSTEDKHESIPTQLDQCRQMAEREGGRVVYKDDDEGFSAYKGNRGPGLERAKQAAIGLAAEHGEAMLVVQHSDRLARGAGDAPGAADHLVEVVASLRRHGVTVRTVQDDFFGDPRIGLMMAAVQGQRNTEDSARKSHAVRDGLKRRKERGAPVGPVPLGYKSEVVEVIDGKAVTRRVIDPSTRPVVERIFDMVEAGSTYGDVMRQLNGEGVTGRRGKPWQNRTVWGIVNQRAYVGEKGYPQIIDPDRFERIHASFNRLDPVQVAKRQGGRKPLDDSFFLRGVVFCSSCGGTLWTRRQAVGRVYICRNRRQGTGLCQASAIPAELIESHVLRHLDTFIGSVEDWIAGRVAERDSEHGVREANLERDRGRLKALDRQRERHLTDYRKRVDEGATTAGIALEEVERIDRQRAEQEQRIAEAEAVVSEWSGPPDVDAALDFYNGLVELVQGRIAQAEGAADLNQALRQVLAGLWVELEDDHLLRAEFQLRATEDVMRASWDSREEGTPRLRLPFELTRQALGAKPGASPR